jgi:hypothetical protein
MRRGARAALKLVFDGIRGLSAVYEETGRRFTVDGRLVGDVGEAIAHSDYGVELHKNQKKGTDGTYDKKGVQVKATFKEHITFTKAPASGILVLCFKLHSDRDKGGALVGHYTEAYNGPSRRLISRYWPDGADRQCRPSVDDLFTLTRGDGLARIPKEL